jgi:hypothetical protein
MRDRQDEAEADADAVAILKLGLEGETRARDITGIRRAGVVRERRILLLEELGVIATRA